MAWEWSHANEAYVNAERNLRDLPRRTLLEILREWAYHDREQDNRIRRRPGAKKPAGFRLPNGVRRLPVDLLADAVWTRACHLRTCTTGGWEAYLCPDGCHTVSFDREGGDDGA